MKTKLRMKSMLRNSLLTLLLLFLGLTASAEVKIPSPDHVMDVAGVLSKSSEKKIVSYLRDFNSKTKATMYVLIIDSLEGESIDGFALRAIDTWDTKAPGGKNSDDGLLLTIAIKDRKLRLDVGQGLEGVITDSRAGDIRRGATKYLRSGNYEKAIHHFIDGSAHYINGSSITGKAYKSGKKTSWPIIIFIIIFILVSFLGKGGRGGGFYVSTGRSRGGFGGGFSGGGSFGSSGGGFSGGGSSGSW